MAFCDGGVRFLRNTIDGTVYSKTDHPGRDQAAVVLQADAGQSGCLRQLIRIGSDRSGFSGHSNRGLSVAQATDWKTAVKRSGSLVRADDDTGLIYSPRGWSVTGPPAGRVSLCDEELDLDKECRKAGTRNGELLG